MFAAPPHIILDGASLFVDFDGTLVELADRPENVIVDAELHRLLGTLRDILNGRLAIVSGRSVATLRGAFGLDDFHLSGSHGLEHALPGQESQTPPVPKEIAFALNRMRDFASGKPGLLVEEKTLGAALHFRLSPERERECRDFCTQLASETGLYLQHGKMLFELRPGNGGKGGAVHYWLAQWEPDAGRPIFIGDDVTDEDGFIAAAHRGGAGILVGPQRESAAHYRLGGVAAVHRWLSEYPEQQRKGG